MTRLFFRNIRPGAPGVRAFAVLIAAKLIVAVGAYAADPPAAEPGKEVDWPHSAYDEETPLRLFLPKKYDEAANAPKLWPLILWFHGTNGRPTTQLLREAGAGENFVLLGMTYLQEGRLQYPQSEDHLRALRQWLAIEAATVPPAREAEQELRDEAIEWFGDEIRKLKGARNADPPRDAVAIWLQFGELARQSYERTPQLLRGAQLPER